MSVVYGSSPIGSQSAIRLSAEVAAWWSQTPHLDEANVGRSDFYLIQEKLGANQSIEIIENRPTLCGTLDTAWNRTVLTLLPKLATPGLLVGMVMILVGMAGCITALTGVKIPGLEILLQNLPASLLFSLTIIRLGVHGIYQAIKFTQMKNRFRQESQEAYKLYQIQKFEKAEGEEARLVEAKRRNNRLPAEARIEHQLPENALYGKLNTDIASARTAVYTFCRSAEKAVAELPKLPAPKHLFAKPRVIDEIELSTPVARAPNWADTLNNWWVKRLPSLGMLNIALGQLMLAAGIAALILLYTPGGTPPGLEILAKDPSLSVSFGFLLLSNAISSTSTGWRMLRYEKREKKRSEYELDLQLIDLGLQMRRVNELCREINLSAQPLINKIKNSVQAALTKKCDKKGKCDKKSLLLKLHKLGKKIVPRLATPSLVIGTLITIIALACLGMSITGYIPQELSLLIKNTPLSVIFSSGLLLAGLHALHRGACLSDRGKKDKAKKTGSAQRNELIFALFSDLLPDLEAPRVKAPKGGEVPHREILDGFIDPKDAIDDSKKAGMREKLGKFMEKKSLWHRFWLQSLKGMWMPMGLLGSFMLISSIAGLLAAYGVKIAPGLEFITQDPSFSKAFCFGLAALGIDAFSTSYRMGTYHQRKKEDQEALQIIQSTLDKVRPQL